MADRIFPTHVNEDPLDSEMVFQGINWDNFNNKLAEVKEASKVKGKLDPNLQAYLDIKTASDDEDDDDSDDDENDDNDSTDAAVKDIIPHLPANEKKEIKDMLNKKASYVFNHPSQLSAEAVEAAIASGDENLKNAILAARHERRVRLASKVETIVKAEAEKNQKLAQRKAYRESLVNKVAAKHKEEEASMKNDCKECGKKCANKYCDACAESMGKTVKAKNKEASFKNISELPSTAKKAFASKALSQGFPQEYVDAMIGAKAPVADNTEEIRNVMASNLATSVKKTAVASMVKEATLSDADYSRLIDYWKNDLGYGDQDWIEALFTKKYDKKS